MSPTLAECMIPDITKLEDFPEEITDRKTMYFVLKGNDWKSAESHAKKLGAKVVRVLTDKEIASEAEDGSYDIQL